MPRALGIRTSDQVRVFNDRGSCVLLARVDDTVRPGVVCAPSVRWGKRSPGKRNVNALTSERLTDAGGGPTFYSCLVQVERIGDCMTNAFSRERRLALRWCCSAAVGDAGVCAAGLQAQAGRSRRPRERRHGVDRSHGRPEDRDPAHQRLLRNRAERLAVDRAALQPGAAPAVRRERRKAPRCNCG